VVRVRLVLGVTLLVAPAMIACAALAGLTDLPPLTDGGPDGASDSTVDGRMDTSAEAQGDGPRDASRETSDSAGGCQGPSSCPAGMACDVATGSCGTTCGATAPCNGGCCSAMTDGVCVSGDSASACGTSGSLCATCTGSNMPTCVDGLCAADCNGSKCAANSCCTGNKTSSMCVSGTTSGQCGSSTACVDCTGSKNGTACLSTGKCGCDTPNDCLAYTTCQDNHVCGARCGGLDGSIPLECNGGCCDSDGFCEPGTANDSCGLEGGVCSVCPTENGTQCLAGGTCGCLTEANCRAYFACNAGACTKDCNASSPCHGGCCNGTCQVGIKAGACGAGGMCHDCTSTCSTGLECLHVLDAGEPYQCGCATTEGCDSSICAGRVCAGFTSGSSPGTCGP
jgi:hypothetical protein